MVQFKHIIGQQYIKEHLIEIVQNNRLSHALLFLGKEGYEALPLAMAFAQYIVCERSVSAYQASGISHQAVERSTLNTQRLSLTNDSCGNCPACKKANALVHPDIHFSYPVVVRKTGEKPISTNFIKEWRNFVTQYPYGNIYDWLQFIEAENKQGNISASECNDIISKLHIKSFESEYKILIMWMPEFLGKEGNKLLKLIEEPPPNTLFLLVAENDEQILPTILSRTQLIKIPALSNSDIENALIIQQSVTPEKAQQIAAIAQGNYREAIHILKDNEENWQALLREWLNAILKTGPHAQVKWIEELAKIGREKQKQFLKYFTHLLQQAIKLKTIGINNEKLIHSHDADFTVRLNKICSLEQHEAIIMELEKAIYYIERNANTKMLFHALTIKLYHIISNNSLILMN